jgi:hypothetical protein
MSGAKSNDLPSRPLFHSGWYTSRVCLEQTQQVAIPISIDQVHQINNVPQMGW